MKKQIIPIIILIPAVYFLSCVLPETDSSSGDAVADYATYNEALTAFPAFDSELLNPNSQLAASRSARTAGDITGPSDIDFVDIGEDLSNLIATLFSFETSIFTLFTSVLKEYSASNELIADQPIVLGLLEFGPEGQTMSLDFGTIQISGTPSDMILYWEVPFSMMMYPTDPERNTFIKIQISKQTSGYYYGLDIDMVTSRIDADKYSAGQLSYFIDSDSGITNSSSVMYNQDGVTRTTTTEGKFECSLLSNNSAVLMYKSNQNSEYVYYFSGDYGLSRVRHDLGSYIQLEKNYFGSNGSVLKNVYANTDISEIITGQNLSFGGGTSVNFHDHIPGSVPDLIYIRKVVSGTASYEYSVDETNWSTLDNYDSGGDLFYMSGAEIAAGDCVYYFDSYSETDVNTYVMTYGKGIIVGHSDVFYNGTYFTMEKYPIMQILPSQGVNDLLCEEGPDHETFIDVYDPETDETERINYVDLNYFFDLDQSLDFDSENDEIFPGLVTVGGWYFDHDLDIYKSVNDSEYYRTTEPLLSFMEHQQQAKLDELDTELTNIDATLFSSYSYETNIQYIADNPIFDTF